MKALNLYAVKFSQFKIYPHFKFIFCRPSQIIYNFSQFQVYLHLRNENLVLHHSGTSVYGLFLQLWGIDHLSNAMIMCNGSESMLIPNVNHCGSVLTIFKSCRV